MLNLSSSLVGWWKSLSGYQTVFPSVFATSYGLLKIAQTCVAVVVKLFKLQIEDFSKSPKLDLQMMTI